MNEPWNQPDHLRPGNDDIPAQLRADLRALYGRAPSVPAELDAHITTLARQRFQARRQRALLLWGGSMAAAAGLLIAAGLALRPAPYQRHGDIRDAFYLSRQLKSGAAIDRQWDINGDNRIDQQDVDALAASAVDLKRLAISPVGPGGTL
ncbi:MAG: hypothetical protein WCI73_05790 [Phycisphaerae bacterium]